MRSVPGAAATGCRHCQLPILDCRLIRIGALERQSANCETRSLRLPVLTLLLQLFFIDERKFHQGVAAVDLQLVANVLAVTFDGAHADG